MHFYQVYLILILDSCEANGEYGGSYVDALQYLQTVAFTIGYGHITPLCHGGRVSIWWLSACIAALAC